MNRIKSISNGEAEDGVLINPNRILSVLLYVLIRYGKYAKQKPRAYKMHSSRSRSSGADTGFLSLHFVNSVFVGHQPDLPRLKIRPTSPRP